MTDDRATKYARALASHQFDLSEAEAGIPACICGEVLRAPGGVDLALAQHQVSAAVIAVADGELAALEQECRDRECTEQDVRARLADAENALARVRALADGAGDLDNGILVWDLRAALDGTS